MDERPAYEITPVADQYSAGMLQAIGALFLACSSAELALRFLLTKLHHPKGGANANTLILLAGMDVSVMLEKIVVGAFFANATSRSEIASICGKIRACFQRRNEIAHNTAIQGGGDHLSLGLVRITSTGKVTCEKTFHRKQIEAFTKDLYFHLRHLSERLNSYGIAPLPEQLERVDTTPG